MKLLKELFGLHHYVSEIDLFLKELDGRFELSAAQREEKNKYAIVFTKRDNQITEQPSKKFWDKF
jgi:hypothetical protein